MAIDRVATELGWAPRHTFEEGLRATVDWYLAHRAWDAYCEYTEAQAQGRIRAARAGPRLPSRPAKCGGQ